MHDLLDTNSVVVLGAGATKAFLEHAPLAIDNYNLKGLLANFRGFPHAYELLELERARRSDGLINIEPLMTRLQGRMPYDTVEAIPQLVHLLSELKREFVRRIRFARKGAFHKEELAAVARTYVKKGVTCITFNYDDVLDQALWEVESQYRVGYSGKQYWHPDGGYGFFVRPSEVMVQDVNRQMDTTSMSLFKLHGSINWFPRKGETPPYNLNAICHDQNWYPPISEVLPAPERELVVRHLEPDPFLIPPVLDKSTLANEPVLQVVWSQAKDALSSVRQIYFVGYSMPVTDLAASFLFSESVGDRVQLIRVINWATHEEDKVQIRAAYRGVFPKLKDEQFSFDGALKWAKEVSASSDSTR